MRTMLRSNTKLLFVVFALLVAVPAMAWAAGDQFQDTLTGSATTQTITSGGSFTNTYYVDAGGPDGCDVSTSSPGVFSINAPGAVSKNPNTNLTFTSCGPANAQTVTFSSSTPGSYNIGASRVSGPVSSTGQAGFTLVVNAPSDNTPPTLNLPANITQEATGASGSPVSYTATADDANPAHPNVTCLPASGATFPIGTTTVNCSANDAANNTASGSFTVTVEDTTPPALSLPDNKVEEATGPGGAAVSFSASATDLVDGSVQVDCSPASSSTFPLGTTTVDCSAEDSSGNSASGSFTVEVRDTTPPAISNMPSNQVVEATSAAGAAVNWDAPTASDAVDGDVQVNCAPDSGSTFPLGTTTVDCTANDNADNTTTESFTVKVQDTTAPSLTLPANQTAEATGPGGATVTFDDPTANDIVDGPIEPDCDAASGDTFPLGTTTVHCSATDAHGNSSSGTFNVKVQDTTGPVLTLPANQTAEATSAAGAGVTYTATAHDAVTGSRPVSCTPASGATFPLGETTVNCSANDGSGNSTSGSFKVTVQDTTAPSLNLPANITKLATGNSGATVTYTASATDLVDGSRPVSCTPASGSTFQVGTTTVNCSATDLHTNTANGSFTVTVNYNWTGFFSPVDNPTSTSFNWNSAKAGQSIPLKFRLSGNQGLSVLDGAPKVTPVACPNASIPLDAIEEYAVTANNGLTYDATADQYNYVWKTQSTYVNKCYKFDMLLKDGSHHEAYFKFLK